MPHELALTSPQFEARAERYDLIGFDPRRRWPVFRPATRGPWLDVGWGHSIGDSAQRIGSL